MAIIRPYYVYYSSMQCRWFYEIKQYSSQSFHLFSRILNRSNSPPLWRARIDMQWVVEKVVEVDSGP